MTESKPIERLEDHGETLRVITADLKNMSWSYLDGRQNILTNEYKDFFTLRMSDSEENNLRIGTAAHVGENKGWSIHGANGIYAEVPFTERPITEEEQKWCQDSPIFDGTESVVEFTIPHPTKLRTAILEENVNRFECLSSVVKDHNSRHEILSSIQQKIAKWKVRCAQLHPERGIITDLADEWNPSKNDEYTRKQLFEMASERKHAHEADWVEIAGYPYLSFQNARSRLIDTDEFRQFPFRLCPLDVAGYTEWTYCQVCGAIGPPRIFYTISVDWTEDQVRACDQCKERGGKPPNLN